MTSFSNFSVATYLGILPCEVINRSILFLLHPYDVFHLKNIHTDCKFSFLLFMNGTYYMKPLIAAFFFHYIL